MYNKNIFGVTNSQSYYTLVLAYKNVEVQSLVDTTALKSIVHLHMLSNRGGKDFRFFKALRFSLE